MINQKRKPFKTDQNRVEIRLHCLGLWAQTFRPADFFNTNQYKLISISKFGARNKIAELSMRVQGVCAPIQGNYGTDPWKEIQIHFYLHLKRNDDDSTKFEYYF